MMGTNAREAAASAPFCIDPQGYRAGKYDTAPVIYAALRAIKLVRETGR